MTLVRNAVKLKYPFLESVRSLLPLCDEFIINAGDSTDATRDLCSQLERESPKVKVFDSRWEGAQTGGLQLSLQTDRALEACRGDWIIYLQADEVLHEEDRDNIRSALKRAHELPEVDGLLFDYLHFYVSYDYLIHGRRWYRKEVRAFKNGRGVRSFRDAQGFRKNGEKLKVLPSGARVFHYGSVRSSESMREKAIEMSQWWEMKQDPTQSPVNPVRHFGLQRFYGTHPKVMRERIECEGVCFDPSEHARRWDKNEIKDVVSLLWESVFHFRVGEYRNYRLLRD